MTYRTFRAVIALLSVLIAVPGARAQAPGVEAFEKAFIGWMQKYKLVSGTLSVAYQGRLVHHKGYNGWDADKPDLLASLSKAVTGACIGTLVDTGRLRFDNTVGELLGDYFRRSGEPGDRRLKSATVAQLLSHRAGFARQGGNDPATGANLRTYLATRSTRDAEPGVLLAAGLRAPLPLEPGQKYDYTDATYLMLGLIVESITGASYEDYCRGAVLRPLGLGKVALDSRWRVLSSFGGWAMSGPEYLVFLRAFAPDSKVLGTGSRRFLADPADKWTTGERTIFYSLGVLVRPVANGYNLWHHGSWRYDARTQADGALIENVGTFASRSASGTSWFAAFRPQPTEGGTLDLDRTLAAAFRSVTTWPAGDGFPALGLQ